MDFDRCHCGALHAGLGCDPARRQRRWGVSAELISLLVLLAVIGAGCFVVAGVWRRRG